MSRGKKKEDVRLMLPWWPGAKRPGHRLAAGVDTTTEAKIPPEPLELGADAFSANDDDTSEHVGHETSPARESFQAATRKEQLRFEDRHSPDRLKHPVELSKSDYTGRIGDADYPSLFDVPTPPVPIVDQYIHDDNLLYEAITKRGRTEALPVNNDERGMLGLEKAVDGWPNAGSLLQDVGPEALLFLDKDIDKVPLSERVFGWCCFWSLPNLIFRSRIDICSHCGIHLKLAREVLIVNLTEKNANCSGLSPFVQPLFLLQDCHRFSSLNDPNQRTSFQRHTSVPYTTAQPK